MLGISPRLGRDIVSSSTHFRHGVRRPSSPISCQAGNPMDARFVS